MEANIILIRCNKENKAFGVRVQKMKDGDWYRTWAFKVNARHAKNEGYDTNKVVGNLCATEEYPGCPYCGSKGFVQCGTCKKLTCWNGEESMTCHWCGSTMDNIVTTTDKFTVTGDKF